MLAFAFAEGAGIDWINVSLIDSYALPAVIGTLGFAAFLASMTLGRWFSDGILLDRFGRVAVVRTQGALAVAGILLFVFGPIAGAGASPRSSSGAWAPRSASRWA